MNDDALMADLKSWARKDAQIEPDVFDCPCYKNCDASAGGGDTLGSGKTCMMSYIGEQFASNVPGEKFRLVLVGIDHGEPEGATFEQRRKGIEDWYQKGGNNFNPHYRGVVKTAAAVFGSTGDCCRRMCTTSCHKSRDRAPSQCVIDRFAQPNCVKCTPIDTVNRTSRATWPMMINCAHHLINELRLLRPRLVVFHGVRARWALIRPEVKSYGLNMNPVGGINDRYGSVLYEWQALGAHILFLYHPSRRWLDKQWDAVVVPALDYLRVRNLIPT